MSFTDKAKNKMEQLTGAAKERVGDMTDNESMRAEGATQQSEARVKQAGQSAKETGKNARDAFR
ncbi:CsbD family protein [Micromonospora sp. 15K316]|uniref:CsbD family protein n=1 Tax=Micromonospora sp. 15K316 TaxID=2530376 RepID=UPI001045CDB7|nr:CsbD family protein [Micromonospora sp. 15K316]TDC24685.1 CsbD family protein [Micromonospora sp. 15K316]